MKTPKKITKEDLMKLRRKVDRQLGLQKVRTGNGPHKSKKDFKRNKRIDIDE